MIITDINVLKAPNKLVKPEEINELISKLEQELYASKVQGVGLAAPQIGINKQIAIIRFNDEKLNLINPKIIETKGIFINKREGCLSVPDKDVNTYRYKEIVVKDDLHPAGIVATDISAIIILHEVQHLSGILITDVEAKGKLGRNDICPCGKIINGKQLKFKNCCGR